MTTKTLTTNTVEFDFFAVFKEVVTTVYVWAARRSERSRLGELDNRLLSDIGMTRDQARTEAGKPFWVA